MTRKELIAFLSQDKEADITQYGKGGWKNLEMLLEQIEAGDVILEYNRDSGLIEAKRLSMKGMLECAGYRLREVRRKYPKSKEERIFGIFMRWKTIEERCEYAISETLRIRRESAPRAIVRGIHEEWRIPIRRSSIKQIPIKDGRDDHWSKAYPRIWSVVYNQWFSITLSKRPWIWDPIINDKSVLVYLEWFWAGAGKEGWYLKLQRQILSFFVRVYVSIRYLV